ncbi:asparagine synthase (glutamine-hydrolyzing) [Candidatus Fermentibacteria bacterium]|nr:MAG: asparagine synthase (glutamine-hydrolyzing) [Candidatus Fermentibacteria bacterium]
MCGISGIISRRLSSGEIRDQLESMGSLQRHRGPDDAREQVFFSNDTLVGLGFVRLAILDLDTGMQPVVSNADGCAIVCNGQIYNYIELREEVSSDEFITRGDIEVALHLYRKKGIEFLDYLNGMYAGAVFDPRRKRVLLFRDRFGIKPLYYTSTEEGFYFSSEIKPLLEGSMIKPELDRESLPVYFSYRYVPGEKTMFRNIRRLPPGSFLDYNLENGSFCVRRYWEYLPGRDGVTSSGREAEDHFIQLLEDAVRIRMRSDVEVASLLSGGIDSSSVASIAAVRQPDIKLFTVSFDDPLYNELDDVRELMKAGQSVFSRASLIHSSCDPGSLEDLPELIRSVEDCISLGTILPTDQVCRLASGHVKVVLTGEGADEVFAGYRKFLLEMAAEEIGLMSEKEKKLLLKDFPELEDYMSVRASDPRKRFIQSELLFNQSELSRLLGMETGEVAFPGDAMPAVESGMHPLNQLLAMECRSRLPDYVVLRLDKLSMRHSLETRTPYLDYRLAEFASGLPVQMKVNLAQRMGKYVCRKSLLNHRVVDPVTAFREKKPFTIPMAAWFLQRDDLPDYVTEIFQGGEIERAGILDPEMTRQLWNSVTADGVGPATLVSEADRIFAVLTFSLWMGEFTA